MSNEINFHRTSHVELPIESKRNNKRKRNSADDLVQKKAKNIWQEIHAEIRRPIPIRPVIASRDQIISPLERLGSQSIFQPNPLPANPIQQYDANTNIVPAIPLFYDPNPLEAIVLDGQPLKAITFDYNPLEALVLDDHFSRNRRFACFFYLSGQFDLANFYINRLLMEENTPLSVLTLAAKIKLENNDLEGANNLYSKLLKILPRFPIFPLTYIFMDAAFVKFACYEYEEAENLFMLVYNSFPDPKLVPSSIILGLINCKIKFLKWNEAYQFIHLIEGKLLNPVEIALIELVKSKNPSPV